MVAKRRQVSVSLMLKVSKTLIPQEKKDMMQERKSLESSDILPLIPTACLMQSLSLRQMSQTERER